MKTSAFVVAPDSALTSSALPGFPLALHGANRGVEPAELSCLPVFARRESRLEGARHWRVCLEERSRPAPVNASLLMATSFHVTLLTTFKGTVRCVVHDTLPPTTEYVNVVISSPALVDGPPEESWTVAGWTLLPDPREALAEGLGNLRGLIELMRAGNAPTRSHALVELARQAAAAMEARRDEDVDEWAQRLAADVADEHD